MVCPCVTPGLDPDAPFALNWNRLDGAAGVAFGADCPGSDFTVFAFGPLSGSSDLRLTPAAALLGLSLTPLVALVSFRISFPCWDGFCCDEDDCCGA